MNRRTDTKPWHHQPLVWMLIMLPTTVVIASFITLYLAISSDDGMVEDDYYQRGKEINQVLDRDHAARRYGLQAQVTLDQSQRKIDLRLQATSTAFAAAEPRLELRVMHATRSGLDQTVIMSRMPDGHYAGVLPVLAQGHWYLQLSAADWRLNGELRIPGRSDVSLSAR